MAARSRRGSKRASVPGEPSDFAVESSTEPAAGNDAHPSDQSAPISARARKFNSPHLAYANAKSVFDKVAPELMKDPNVVSVDLGLKQVLQRVTNQLAIRIHVRQKIHDTQLADDQQFPADFAGIPTDVIISKPFQLSSVGPTRLVGGDAIGVANSGRFGTMGIDVICTDDAVVRLLTCAHVVQSNGTFIGVPTVDRSNAAVGNSVRGALSQDFDCALIEESAPRSIRFGLPPSVPHQPRIIRYPNSGDISQTVWKLGQATILKLGTITSIHSLSIPIVQSDGTTWFVNDHIQISPQKIGTPFADLGDSGAVVVMVDEAIGIIRGINSTSGEAVASVLAAAALTLDFDFS